MSNDIYSVDGASGGGSGVTSLTGDVTGTGPGATATTIANDAVTNAKAANMAQSTIKGRAVGAGTGDPTDLTATQATAILNTFTSALQGLAPASGGGTANFLRADGTWATPPDVDTGITQLTSDVTAGPGSGSQAATIANDAVTNAKMANMAASTFKARITGSTGDPEDITGTQATTLLDAFTSGLKGLAPASGGGTANFLRADGTWATPPDVDTGITQLTGDITAGPGSGSQVAAIAAGVIVNNDCNASMNLDRSKIASGNNYRLVTNGAAGAMTDAAAITGARALISDANGIPTHSTVTSTELGYLSGTTGAIRSLIKEPCLTVAIANVTLSGEQTIDDVTTDVSRVLLTAQTTRTQNGIYVSSPGAWSRATDADSTNEVNGMIVPISGGGTTYHGSLWRVPEVDGYVLGSNDTDLVQIFPGNPFYTGAGGLLRLSAANGRMSFGSIVNADVSSSAAIARSKCGLGTANHVVTNSGTGAFSSEATLAASRGGFGISTASSTGVPTVSSGTWSVASTLSIARGGTNAATAIAALRSLSPAATAISASDIDWSASAIHTKTLAANTTFTFSNTQDGQTILVYLTNTASNYTVTWPTVVWQGGSAPTQTIGAKSDLWTFTKIGSNILGTWVPNFS